MGKIYRTSSGIPIDMEAIRSRHAREVAVGNMNVNAQGDRLGKGGKVVKKAQDVYRAQQAEHSSSTTKQVSIKDMNEVATVTPPATKPTKSSKKKETTLPNGDIIVSDQNPGDGIE